jgi:ABC-2 type transport system ATP-binding protein
MQSAVTVRELTKIFTIPVKKAAKPESSRIIAVANISFDVKEGEVLGFIGPNGAGKSTTIKMLTGILLPTSGSIKVAGFDPQTERNKLVMQIGTVFGQRSQLVYNLPVTDSFDLFSKLYELDSARYLKRRKYLFDAFSINEYALQPVRKLSLGQRMRAEVALALLHEPKIVFLDEPTIGLDIVAKQALRDTLLKLNKEQGTTIFLTSHDIGDIEMLTKRTIVVNHGQIVVDEDTLKLKNRYMQVKSVHLSMKEKIKEFKDQRFMAIKISGKDLNFKVDTKKYAINEIIKDILNRYQVEDIDIANPELEDVIREIYQKQ